MAVGFGSNQPLNTSPAYGAQIDQWQRVSLPQTSALGAAAPGLFPNANAPSAAGTNPIVMALLGPVFSTDLLNQMAASPTFSPFALLAQLTGANRNFTPSYGTDSRRLRSALQFEQRKDSQSDVEPHGPYTCIQERGAGAYSAYRDLANFAHQHDSRDGTPITGDSSYGQDVWHLGESRSILNDSLQRFNAVKEDPSLLSDDERCVLARIERDARRQPHTPGSLPDLLYRTEALQSAVERRGVSSTSPLARANGELFQCLEMQGRVQGDIYHKWARYRPDSAPSPDFGTGLLGKYYAQSPFNPQRMIQGSLFQ